MDQNLQFSQNSGTRETSKSSCFICLNNAFHSTDPYGDSDYQPRDFGYLRKWSRKDEEKYNLDSVNILTSYILQNSSSTSSDHVSDSNGECERDELQRSILSSFGCGQLSICSECLSKAKTLLEYQKELERIQLQILDVLGNLQTHLKSSTRRRRRGKELEEGSGTDLSRFQEILDQEFVSSSLSVTLDFDNQSSMESVQDEDDNIEVEDRLNQNGMDDDDDEDSTEQEAEGNFICHSCPEVFTLKSRLDLHIDLAHPPDKNIFKCPSCPKRFQTKSGLYTHKKSHHEAPDLVVCPHCPKMMYKHGLYYHLKKAHGTEKPEYNEPSTFSCKFCPKTFDRLASLKVHEEAHLGEKKYKCPDCPYVGITKGNLANHRRGHREKTLVCQYCSKPCREKRDLMNHERTHTNEKPFKCRVCDRMFTSSNRRSTHQRMYHGIRGKFLARVGQRNGNEKPQELGTDEGTPGIELPTV